ncbi:MAG: hypothetical protein LBI28_10730 [Treponema sp.]|jgi:hypothetical protein|nr:hypothetical protein [Treponema sp.]
MKKLLLLNFLVLITVSSCLEFLEVSRYARDSNRDNDIRGNVIIYVENRTRETVIVFAMRKRDDVELTRSAELARILEGGIQRINLQKGATINVIGGNSNRKYMEAICNQDQETFVIY